MKKGLIFALTWMMALLAGCGSHGSIDYKSAVMDSIGLYIDRLVKLTGMENVEIEREMNYAQLSNSTTRLSDNEYSREDLEQPEPYVMVDNGIDPEFLINISALLEEFRAVIEIGEEFREDDFMEIETELFQYVIKAVVDGDYLFIESYRFDPIQQPGAAWADIFEFDLIEDKVSFRSLREYDNGEHVIEYDEFSEVGNIIHASINAEDQTFLAYQVYDRERQQSMEIGQPGPNRIYFNFNPADGAIHYSIRFDDNKMLRRNSIRFGSFPTSFWYIKEETDVHLSWNLHLVQGWNRCRVFPLSSDQIFQDETQKLSGFDINIDLIDKSAVARLSTTPALFTAAMMDLSAYDMLFDLVTWDDLQDAIDFAHQQHLTVLALYGLSLDMGANFDAMMNLITLHSDETMMERVTQEHAG